ncbi:hypothetical protein RF11_02275 [Thelohanellus kitauei]|uniref:Uncharacterized protein n=1 Tax=Thelohanellus kitauei TaxID=669202 RepID=A0A0C2M902_THEKT|nr:hypothetical protein RF11_02275 [Thelohanellus kitauei]
MYRLNQLVCHYLETKKLLRPICFEFTGNVLDFQDGSVENKYLQHNTKLCLVSSNWLKGLGEVISLPMYKSGNLNLCAIYNENPVSENKDHRANYRILMREFEAILEIKIYKIRYPPGSWF